MVARRGISLLDLVLGLPLGSASVLLPDDVQHTLESLAVLEHTSTVTAASYIHEGTTQALGEQPLALPSVLGWKLDAPVVTTGLRFRVVRTRNNAVGGQNVEPPSTTGTVDLYLDPLALTIPGLVPAVVAGGTFGSANPAHLVPAATRGDVRIWGRGSCGSPSVRPVGVALVDWPDPLNPNATTGTVTELAFDPPTFLVGESGFGATVDRVVVDVSPAFTPADIVARGQDATWQGISLREGTLYLPRNAPIVGDLSIGLHDLLVGVPPGDNGVQGELSIEFGRTPVSPAVVAFTDHDGALETEINAAGYTLVRLRRRRRRSRRRCRRPPPTSPPTRPPRGPCPTAPAVKTSRPPGPSSPRRASRCAAAFTELVGDRRVPGDELTFVFTLAATVATDPTADHRRRHRHGDDRARRVALRIAARAGRRLVRRPRRRRCRPDVAARRRRRCPVGQRGRVRHRTSTWPREPTPCCCAPATGSFAAARCPCSSRARSSPDRRADRAIATAATSASASCSPPTTWPPSIATAAVANGLDATVDRRPRRRPRRRPGLGERGDRHGRRSRRPGAARRGRPRPAPRAGAHGVRGGDRDRRPVLPTRQRPGRRADPRGGVVGLVRRRPSSSSSGAAATSATTCWSTTTTRRRARRACRQLDRRRRRLHAERIGASQTTSPACRRRP